METAESFSDCNATKVERLELSGHEVKFAQKALFKEHETVMARTSRANDFHNSIKVSAGDKHLWGENNPAVLHQRNFPLSSSLTRTSNVPRLRLSGTRPPSSEPLARASQSARAPPSSSDWVVPLPLVGASPPRFSSSSTPRRRSMPSPRSPRNTLSPQRSGLSTERAGNPAQRRPGPGDPEGYSEPGGMYSPPRTTAPVVFKSMKLTVEDYDFRSGHVDRSERRRWNAYRELNGLGKVARTAPLPAPIFRIAVKPRMVTDGPVWLSLCERSRVDALKSTGKYVKTVSDSKHTVMPTGFCGDFRAEMIRAVTAGCVTHAFKTSTPSMPCKFGFSTSSPRDRGRKKPEEMKPEDTWRLATMTVHDAAADSLTQNANMRIVRLPA